MRSRCSPRRARGSALVEFAIVLPLLVVFVVGIYDFSAAFNQKQKVEHAAQEGSIVAGNQPTGDMDPALPPLSLQPAVDVIFNSLAADGVLPLANQGSCKVPVAAVSNGGLQWTYAITGCPDTVTIVIDRGVVDLGSVGTVPATIRTAVSVSYPYHWQFNRAIQLVVPGATYLAITNITETATVHNQI